MNISRKTKKNIEKDAREIRVSKRRVKEIDVKVMKVVSRLPKKLTKKEKEKRYMILISAELFLEYVKNI